MENISPVTTLTLMYVVERAQTNKLIRNLWQAYSCESYDRSWSCIDLMINLSNSCSDEWQPERVVFITLSLGSKKSRKFGRVVVFESWSIRPFPESIITGNKWEISFTSQQGAKESHFYSTPDWKNINRD